jgi:hypothetical protein
LSKSNAARRPDAVVLPYTERQNSGKENGRLIYTFGLHPKKRALVRGNGLFNSRAIRLGGPRSVLAYVIYLNDNSWVVNEEGD